MSKSSSEGKLEDFIRRGVKKSSSAGIIVLIGLRALDPLLQYAILGRGLGSSMIPRIGGTTLPPGALVTTNTIIDKLGLSPHRLTLFLMTVGAVLKSSYWAAYTSQEELPVGSAVLISLYNSALNSLNTLLFTCSQTSASSIGENFSQPRLLVGCILYILGLVAEAVAETQRKRFKQNSANEGKVYDKGLFSLARHINYGAYSLWRAGFALASAGWIFGSLMGAYFFYDFATRGVPALDRYCQDRYGKQWTNYKAKVPYALLPMIY
ncbi:hypothetical protein EV356DRAFT_526851 [Viridothelium virens]|uniref:Steroid 5-alpha reductase C-terminal domain-containing protein n=1 Tax=Viridothelium virens TaxID=1048519 RepID=A0A6A6GWP3_VIRVR|nr:hypothetical protein EV356DRAFT_526851 [Viridothelium virens]